MAQPQADIQRFRAYLQRRNYATHTLESYTLDLELFFAGLQRPAATISHQDIEHFVERQHAQGLAPATMNRRLHALKHFFDFLLEYHKVLGNPVKPSHFARLGRPLPRALSAQQVHTLFAHITTPMDQALFGLMLRCGLRVSEAVQLKREHIDWEKGSFLIAQSKGQKDRHVYLDDKAAASLKEALALRPPSVPDDRVFWNRKRPHVALNVKAVQKKMERYSQAAGLRVSCHQLRHTFASNLLEHGAEVVSIKELLGHTTIKSSERYARISNRKVKEEYLRTMKKVIQQTKV
jgi:site-specific recombinase XerD